jgi:hypothetical protein
LRSKVEFAAVLLLAVVYFSYVFQFFPASFRSSGIGDWGIELHQLPARALVSQRGALANPVSPPMRTRRAARWAIHTV